MTTQQIRGHAQVFSGSLTRDLMNLDTPGMSVITKLIATGGITLVDSTGIDVGTGEVTISGTGGYTQEEIEDIIGNMVSGNTETGVAVTYNDALGKLDFDAQTAGDSRYELKSKFATWQPSSPGATLTSTTDVEDKIYSVDLSSAVSDVTFELPTGSQGARVTVNIIAPHATYGVFIATTGGSTINSNSGTFIKLNRVGQSISFYNRNVVDWRAFALIPLKVKELDGSPSVEFVNSITFSGATVVDDGYGNVSVNISGVSVAWGDITGTLSNQTDLQSALNAKATVTDIREKLTASRTYYVRTDGSDSNTGLVNSSGGAFLTVQKAVNTVAELDINGNTVTIQIADGTYTGSVVLKNTVGFQTSGNLVIQGNSGTPANVLISVTSANAFEATGLSSVWRIKDLKITTTTAGNCIYAIGGSVIEFGNIDFGASATAHIRADTGGLIRAISNYSITGAATYHYLAQSNGVINVLSLTITLTGTPAITYTVLSEAHVDVRYNTYSGSSTGTRYLVRKNGVVNTDGASSTYLPGSIAGSTATGGQYV